jgi:2-oxoglutarate dehydrogenase E1 component
VRNLIHAFRSRGHLRAKTNPVRERKDRQARLNLADFGLSDSDLDTKFRQGEDLGLGQGATLREIVAALTSIYAGTVGFEYTYIRDPQVLEWFQQKAEHGALPRRRLQKAHLEEAERSGCFRKLLAYQVSGSEALLAGRW